MPSDRADALPHPDSARTDAPATPRGRRGHGAASPPPDGARQAARREELRARRQQAALAARRTDRSIIMVAAVLVVAALGLLLWMVSDVLLLVFAGILVAVFLRSLGNGLAAMTGISVNLALAVVLALLLTCVLAGVWFLGGEIANQLGQLLPRLETAWGTTLDYLYRYEWGAALLNERTIGVLAPGDADWVSHLAGLFSTTLGAIASCFIILFIGLYLAIAPRTYRNGLLHLIPARGRRRAGEVLAALDHTLHWWLIGTFAKMVVIGAFTTVGLLLLDIPLALALGLLAALLEFIPYLGPILSSVPAILVALTATPMDALYVALLYLGVQSAEGYVVAPLIDQRSVHLPPALAITAQLLLGVTLGVVGVIFATPLTAVTLVLVKKLYIEDQLGESASGPLRTAPPQGGS